MTMSTSIISADSPILAPPTTGPESAITYLTRKGSVYSSFDLGVIVNYYWRFGPTVNIDPLLAIAQAVHETSEKQADGRWLPLSSWWAQLPRRNPAGLGVTGRVMKDTPPNPAVWAYDEEAKVWKNGLSFSSWEISVQAHIGRLLAYAITDEQANPAQKALIDYALSFRPLPAANRGVAPTLRGLNGKWAVPGLTYADRIASIARRILAQNDAID